MAKDDPKEGRMEQARRWAEEEWRSTPWDLLWKALLSELIGSFLLTLFGCGAAIATDNFGWTLTKDPPDTFSYGDTYHLVVALGFGLTTGTVVAMFEALSGGHANPAVTLSFMVSARMNVVAGILYFPMQFIGAGVGCGILKLIKGTMNHRDDVFPLGVYTEHGMYEWQGFIWEIILAIHLCMMYLVVMDDSFQFLRFTSPLLIANASIINHLATLYATGGSANPARALAAAVVSNKGLDILWLFLHVSGAHMNPSVTLGMLVIRKVALVRGLLYMPAQFLGSLAGSGLLKLYASSGCNNPARAIGASIVSLEFEYLWVFVSFSPAGAILGAVLHYLLFLEAHADEPDEAFLPPKKR